MSKLLKLSLGLAIAALIACSSEPKVTELSHLADPQQELERVSENIKQAQIRQLDVLSPTNFEAAKDTRDKAVKARASNKNQKKVLHEIALAQAYLDKASKVGDVANQLLKGPIEARQAAIAAKSEEFFLKETRAADKELKDITLLIEKNDTSKAQDKGAVLEAQYRDIEIKSIKKDKLGAAHDTIQKAIKEGAKKFTPETLDRANKRYAEDESTITLQPHNATVVNEASADATASANRLLKMVRTAKSSTEKNPEDFAKQVEKSDLTASQLKSELTQTSTELSKSQDQLADQGDRNQQLQSKLMLDKEFEKARSQFSKEEAEVYRQGNKILLRLKGLSFPTNQAAITSNNFPLLSKVQTVISDVGSTQVVVEGHTDSIGGKKLNKDLSTKRAESVLSYLVSNKDVAADKITAEGYGDSKPIASNKTSEGRAQNRRVDVIISAEPTTKE